MQTTEYQVGRTFVGRLPLHGDIVQELATLAKERGIRTGWISLIGTVRRARLGSYDPQSGEYQLILVDHFAEVVSCQGNVSFNEGEPFVHLHIVLSDAEGKTLAGHLFESTVFVGEFWLQEVEGVALERVWDAETGLPLWRI